jgi:toxin ParE1/3/4
MLQLSRRAVEDLQIAYLDGLERHGRRQADAYVDDLLEALDRLADFPRLGMARSELGPTSRALVHKVHVVLYRTEGDDVFVRRIRHAREDWQNEPPGDGP